MEHISFFIFILLLQNSMNNQIYAAIPMKPDGRVQIRGGDLPITTKKDIQEGSVFKSVVVKKELMEFTQSPVIISYAMETGKPTPKAINIWNNIPYLSPANYTQLKKIKFRRKTKGRTADKLKMERKREEEKRFAEQSKVVDAKKKLQALERELEIKRELGRAELEPPNRVVISKRERVKVKQPLSAKTNVIPEREKIKVEESLSLNKHVIPERETIMQSFSPIEYVTLERDLLKKQSPLFAKDLLIRKPRSDKSDSSDESNENFDADRLDLIYDLDNEHDLKVKW